jgi:enoyl-CoA hydratase/carnithine racemase
LVNQICAPEELKEAVVGLAKRIARHSPLALKWAKKCLNMGQETGLSVGLAYEALAESLLFTSKDRQEGMRAFFEKRKPRFKGE